ncbi:hypothetical protein HAP48_0042730 [Bradyrhizobium septentrionale]|uniref:Uncharacterized protein n=1 Tax=Bradyrhizobium septentrionale TaxID=1404411 RepID=A0A974A2R9_9BRAD|nr:hypothetical protein [Bradyrhizobium septentrionale]UGY15174.1 hypothetical protein HAP48_0042730 [Bradyrhizobium septentrionale]
MSKDLTVGSIVFEPARNNAPRTVEELSRVLFGDTPTIEVPSGVVFHTPPFGNFNRPLDGIAPPDIIAGRQAPDPLSRYRSEDVFKVLDPAVLGQTVASGVETLVGTGAAQAEPGPGTGADLSDLLVAPPGSTTKAPELDPEAVAYMRDVFAAHAMSGLLASCVVDHRDLASTAYDVAALMLAERARRG